MTIHWKPENTPTLTPAMPGGKKLIAFLTSVFDAEISRLYEAPGGAVAHAEIRIGESQVMTGDSTGDHVLPPGSAHVYVPDVDAAYKRALEAGATSKQEPKDQFYGDRTARVVDASGNQWSMVTHKEDVSDDEMQRRMDALMKGG